MVVARAGLSRLVRFPLTQHGFVLKVPLVEDMSGQFRVRTVQDKGPAARRDETRYLRGRGGVHVCWEAGGGIGALRKPRYRRSTDEQEGGANAALAV